MTAATVERTEHPLSGFTDWVLMRDDFLSNWGDAKGKNCWYVYACRNASEAGYIKKYAKSRGDQECVTRYSLQKPRTDLWCNTWDLDPSEKHQYFTDRDLVIVVTPQHDSYKSWLRKGQELENAN